MDILLYKDGHLAVSESPLEGKENNLDDVVMLITNPQEGDSLTYKSGKWVNDQGGSGGGGGALIIVEGETTWQQVYNALAAGIPVVAPYVEDGAHVYCDYASAAIHKSFEGEVYYGVFIVGQNLSTDDSPTYIAETADGALIHNEGD